MNLRPLLVLVLTCSVTGLGGCKDLLKKKDPDAAPSATPVATTPPPAVVVPEIPTVAVPVAAAPVVDETATPTPQDFEDEAAAKVTAANFKTEFATLKTAISK